MKKMFYISCLFVFFTGYTIRCNEPRIEIDKQNMYSLNGIKVVTESGWFYPSFFGGVSVVTQNGIVYHPWSEKVKFTLLNSHNSDYEWIMYIKGEFYFHYNISLERRKNTIVINLKDAGKLKSNDTLNYEYAEIAAVYLDRSENSYRPYIIGVPYLTLFNILYSNDCFVSIYFDWNKTNASQLIPYNNVHSPTSVYYSQYALYNKLTNGKRNQLNETILVKVSNDIDEVFPEIHNPTSEYYEESAKRIIFDDWQPFDKSYQTLQALKTAGISNIWHILHDWQKGGYDVSLPDVYPANEKYGGNNQIRTISDYNKINRNLFALHENYIDVFKTSSKYSPDNLALNSSSNFIFNWFNPNNSDSSFLVKPEKVLSILTPISTIIHNELGTTSSYHDVSSSYDPSKFVDYESDTKDAGKFIQPYIASQMIADSLRKIHEGPVSGEGLSHYLYSGFYDDFSAQIHTGKSLPGAYYGQSEKYGGFYKPLLVNFDLLKMKNKTFVHGLGFYERFFYNKNYWEYMGKSRDSALIYAATEIAYGHGAFFSSHSCNIIEQSAIEYTYVYPLQLLYSNARVVEILFNDRSDNRMYTASDYIRKYPDTFDDFNSSNFMSRICVKYDNNLVIFVNRHPKFKWEVNIGQNYGYYNFHAEFNQRDSLFSGSCFGGKMLLPQSSGWLAFFSN